MLVFSLSLMIDMSMVNIFPGTIYLSESTGISEVVEGGHLDVIAEGRHYHGRIDC